MREQFSEDELLHLSLAIVSINGGPAVRGGCAGVRCNHRHSRCCLTGRAPGAGRDERRAAERERRVFDGPLRFTPEGKTYRVESGDKSADRGMVFSTECGDPNVRQLEPHWRVAERARGVSKSRVKVVLFLSHVRVAGVQQPRMCIIGLDDVFWRLQCSICVSLFACYERHP
jgi:hypothetical protein